MDDKAYLTALTTYLEGFVSERRKGRLHEVLNERTHHICLVLEDVYQSHNFSAVLRSADIFGVQNIHFIENRNRYKISEDVSMGSTQWLTLKRYQEHQNNTVACLRNLKEKGYKIVATSLEKNSVTLNELNITQPFALVFGTELTGISANVESMADEFVKLPMYGFTESFNISVCAALCMHQLSTRMRNEIENYKLSPPEKEIIYLEWLKTSVKKPELIIQKFNVAYFNERQKM